VIVTASNLRKELAGSLLFEGVSFSVDRRQRLALSGPNGSGKTTLFNSIVGHHPIDGGSIRFQGREISKLRVPQIARLGLLRTFQQTRLYDKMTCLQNMRISAPEREVSLLEMFARFPPEVDERAEALLEFTGLHAKRHLLAGELSFGQQKLLEFAMALMAEPKLLLLDEPTAGINPTLINGLIERLQRVNADLAITLLVIEHNMRVIMNLAEHIYCLAHGELLASGPPEQIRDDQRVIDAYLGAH
jgi:branched-chain amino acid transport system ATP-binding protein